VRPIDLTLLLLVITRANVAVVMYYRSAWSVNKTSDFNAIEQSEAAFRKMENSTIDSIDLVIQDSDDDVEIILTK